MERKGLNMSYYRQSCSPYDVQAQQGGRFTFATIKERYENTIPLRGKRKEENVRPIKRRDRSWERIFKVDDNEYYISFDSYKWRTVHNKGITWQMRDGMEYMTIHTPRKTWDSQAPTQLYPRYLSSASVFWFYDFNMPNEFSMVNHYVNKYICYQDKYYSIELGDIVFQRKEGVTEWQPLVVHRQVKHHIDKQKVKELKESIKPFLDYYDIMSPVAESEYGWGNPIIRAVLGENEYREVKPHEAVELFKQTEGKIPDGWFTMVEIYKNRITTNKRLPDGDWSGSKEWREDLPRHIAQDLFQLAKPCKEIEVPLGQLCIDRYKSWYR